QVVHEAVDPGQGDARAITVIVPAIITMEHLWFGHVGSRAAQAVWTAQQIDPGLLLDESGSGAWGLDAANRTKLGSCDHLRRIDVHCGMVERGLHPPVTSACRNAPL